MSGERPGVGNASGERGRGEEGGMGRTASRGSERDFRRGGEAVGGLPASLREGERPRCGLEEEIKSALANLGKNGARARKTL